MNNELWKEKEGNGLYLIWGVFLVCLKWQGKITKTSSLMIISTRLSVTVGFLSSFYVGISPMEFGSLTTKTSVSGNRNFERLTIFRRIPKIYVRYMNMWWCLQWDSVVYTAAPPPSHDGPHPPGKPGGPACRGQGSRPRNGKIFSTHWRAQILRSLDGHSNIGQTQVNNANIVSWEGFPAEWGLSCFSCHRHRRHWLTIWLTLELID
jgi:hypothetical protein